MQFQFFSVECTIKVLLLSGLAIVASAGSASADSLGCEEIGVSVAPGQRESSNSCDGRHASDLRRSSDAVDRLREVAVSVDLPGDKLYEVEIVVTEDSPPLIQTGPTEIGTPQWDWDMASDKLANEHRLGALLPSFTLIESHPGGTYPGRWVFRRTATLSFRDTLSLLDPVAWSDFSDDLHRLLLRPIRFDITARLLTDECYMITTVSGGRGEGTYTGHVAVLGSPTGVSDDDLNMWFGDPEDTAESQYLQDFEDAMSSQAMQGAMQEMTNEERRQLEAFYGAAGAAAQQSDPILEVREMLTLTLQDVRFDEQGPSAGQGGSMTTAMAHIANKFVLSAQLISGETLPGDGGPVGVERVGLKGPGLGLASTHVEGCQATKKELKLTPCTGEIAQQLGAYCGTLEAEVCHEENSEDILTINAEFLAARSLEDCIR